MRSILLLPLFVLLLNLASAQTPASVQLTDGWKFMPGDDLSYAAPLFDDSGWKPIRGDAIWENQGYEKLDRFAWYRFRIHIPSSLKASSRMKDGLRFTMGKINNFDQTFLNGSMLGINNRTVAADTPADTAYLNSPMEFWNMERVYVIPLDDPRIRWDEDNIIAVRVFDQGGQGGLWSGGQHIRPVMMKDYLDIRAQDQTFTLEKGQWQKEFTVINTSANHRIDGDLTVAVTRKLSGALTKGRPVRFSLTPGDSVRIPVRVPATDAPMAVTYKIAIPSVGDTSTTTEDVPYILTPAARPTPRINAASRYGARPGHEFIFTIAASGSRPMTFTAKGLPAGLRLDRSTGIISGIVAEAGVYPVTCTATNAKGTDTKVLTFVLGKDLALTPPLGWNSWNCWGLTVDAAKVVASATSFKNKGLMDHGWSFINIDDGWEIKGDSPALKRAMDGTIFTNEKFPDMKGLADTIHSMGLKLGIYSSPGTLTCGGYTASYQYELNDARTWAAWGIDYLKYDWCSYEKVAKDTSRPELMRPYIMMRGALDQVNRDIVYSLCQYGMGNVWEWGESVGGDLWRTTGDITDSWESLRDIGFSQVANAPYAGPSRWNDPDMLVVGWVGWGPNLHPTKLTPDEQYLHISLWSMLSAPMLIGCDLERLDDFTLNLLTNDEVIAIDQDPLGKQAVPVQTIDSVQVWMKQLSDGSRAIAVFNLGGRSASLDVDLKKIGLSGVKVLRDVWRQRSFPCAGDRFHTSVASHGVTLLRTEPLRLQR